MRTQREIGSSDSVAPKGLPHSSRKRCFHTQGTKEVLGSPVVVIFHACTQFPLLTAYLFLPRQE